MSEEELAKIRYYDSMRDGKEMLFFPIMTDVRNLLKYVDTLRAEIERLRAGNGLGYESIKDCEP